MVVVYLIAEFFGDPTFRNRRFAGF